MSEWRWLPMEKLERGLLCVLLHFLKRAVVLDVWVWTLITAALSKSSQTGDSQCFLLSFEPNCCFSFTFRTLMILVLFLSRHDWHPGFLFREFNVYISIYINISKIFGKILINIFKTLNKTFFGEIHEIEIMSHKTKRIKKTANIQVLL